MKCWAASIGPCAGGVSREHIVSEALFSGPAVEVRGLPWCKDKPKVVGLGSLTARILCAKHNNDLSPLDAAASDAFNAIRRFVEVHAIRSKIDPRARVKVERYQIDARLLERWMLKTLINLTFESEYVLGRPGSRPGHPSNEHAAMCYGLRPFSNDAGMYVLANEGMKFKLRDVIGFAPYCPHDTRVLEGACFNFAGLLLFLNLMPERPIAPVFTAPEDSFPAETRVIDLMRPFKKFSTRHGKYFSQIVEFRW